jgi:hypothetical protein
VGRRNTHPHRRRVRAGEAHEAPHPRDLSLFTLTDFVQVGAVEPATALDTPDDDADAPVTIAPPLELARSANGRHASDQTALLQFASVTKGLSIMTDQNPSQPTRVFRIGTTRIVEDASMSALDNTAVRDLLVIALPGDRQRHHPRAQRERLPGRRAPAAAGRKG